MSKKKRVSLRNKKKVFQGKKIAVETVEVKYTSDFVATRERVVHPGAVAILPILSDGKILLNRQHRIGPDLELWEIPAGTLEKGEKPHTCARRELLEETGYSAKRLKRLGKFHPTPGYSSELIYLYVAEGLSKQEDSPVGHVEEGISNRAFSPERVFSMIRSGAITDGKTLLALLLWKEQLWKK